MGTYFSIDYRSPPSGMGQIIKPNQPDMLGDLYNYTLVSIISDEEREIYTEKDLQNTGYVDNHYIHTKGIWLTKSSLKTLHEYLASQGVESVYDSELQYDYPDKCDSNGHFLVDTWIKIVNNQLSE